MTLLKRGAAIPLVTACFLLAGALEGQAQDRPRPILRTEIDSGDNAVDQLLRDEQEAIRNVLRNILNALSESSADVLDVVGRILNFDLNQLAEAVQNGYRYLSRAAGASLDGDAPTGTAISVSAPPVRGVPISDTVRGQSPAAAPAVDAFPARESPSPSLHVDLASQIVELPTRAEPNEERTAPASPIRQSEAEAKPVTDDHSKLFFDESAAPDTPRAEPPERTSPARESATKKTPQQRLLQSALRPKGNPAPMPTGPVAGSTPHNRYRIEEPAPTLRRRTSEPGTWRGPRVFRPYQQGVPSTRTYGPGTGRSGPAGQRIRIFPGQYGTAYGGNGSSTPYSGGSATPPPASREGAQPGTTTIIYVPDAPNGGVSPQSGYRGPSTVRPKGVLMRLKTTPGSYRASEAPPSLLERIRGDS